MRKLLVMALVAATFSATAQDDYKPVGGEWNFELGLAPLGGNPMGLLGGIKVRKWSDASTNIRGEVFLGFNSSTSPNNTEPETTDSQSSFNLQLRGGIEKHWAGTNRLSPYYAFIGIIDFGSSSSTSEFIDGNNNVVEGKTTDGNFGIGAAALLGVDYYVARNLYLGTEFGFGLLYNSLSDTKTTSGSTTTTTANGNSFDLGPIVVAQIRVGWLF